MKTKEDLLGLFKDVSDKPSFEDIHIDKKFKEILDEFMDKIENAKVEPSLLDASAEDKFQFVRCGYFVKDMKNENTFNRIVGLKDSFPKK